MIVLTIFSHYPIFSSWLEQIIHLHSPGCHFHCTMLRFVSIICFDVYVSWMPLTSCKEGFTSLSLPTGLYMQSFKRDFSCTKSTDLLFTLSKKSNALQSHFKTYTSLENPVEVTMQCALPEYNNVFKSCLYKTCPACTGAFIETASSFPFVTHELQTPSV